MAVCLTLGAALLVGALLLVFAARAPVTLNSNAQGKAEPSGAWAVACGLGCGPFALSAIAAAGVKPFLTVHVFGRQLVRLPLSRWVRRRRRVPSADVEASLGAAREPEADTPLSRFERGVGGLFRSLDPLEMLLGWWDKERRFEVRSLVVDVEYSFRDVALTGRILAGLYMLSAVLPDVCEIHQTPSWESEDRVLLGLDGAFKIWPGRLLLDLARFVLNRRATARRSAALAKRAAQST